MRVLVVSHCMIPREVRKRLDALARLPEVEAVEVVVPLEWKEPLSTIRLSDFQSPSRGDEEGIDRDLLPESETLLHTVTGLPVRFGGHPGAYTFVGLDAVVRRFRPDVIHCDSEPWSLAAVQTLRVAGRLRERPVLTVYTCDNMEIRLRPWGRWARERSLAGYDGLLCMSEEAVAFARKKGYQGPAVVCPLVGVDPLSYKVMPREKARAELGLRERFTIGFVGRLVPEKGVLDLLAAFEESLDAELLYLGKGPLLEKLRQGGSRVTVADAVPHAQVPRWLSAMDVLVLPSVELHGRWKEQFGHVIIEAMSCGCAVIGSDSGAIPEVIGSAGLIYPAGDVGALADRLHRLRDDEAEREELCIMGIERVRGRYTHEVVARCMHDFWVSLQTGAR